MSHSGISKCQLPRLPRQLSRFNTAFEIITILKRMANIEIHFCSRGNSEYVMVPKGGFTKAPQMNYLSFSLYAGEKMVIDVSQQSQRQNVIGICRGDLKAIIM